MKAAAVGPKLSPNLLLFASPVGFFSLPILRLFFYPSIYLFPCQLPTAAGPHTLLSLFRFPTFTLARCVCAAARCFSVFLPFLLAACRFTVRPESNERVRLSLRVLYSLARGPLSPTLGWAGLLRGVYAVGPTLLRTPQNTRP